MAETPTVRSLPRTLRVDVLSPEALAEIDRQTLEVLETTGVHVDSESLLRDLGEAGASVDLEQERVRFPAEMVKSCLRSAPSELTLAARAPGADLVLDGSRGYLSVDGCAAEILDSETGERRASNREDLVRASRLADALPEIGQLWQPVSIRDVAPEVKPLHELHAQLGASGKHIQMMTAVTAAAAAGVIDIARAVAGGSEALRERPIVSAFQCSLSPLAYEGEALKAARLYAEAGIPCGFVVMPISCATGPATTTGVLVQSNAEALAGIVMLQALAPGAATFYGSCATVMDLRTGAAACGGPEDLLLQMASAQLARHYGVPSCVGTFATGAKRPDWQAGLENGLSGLVSALAGADLICGAGLLFGARVFSLEEMVLDCEIFRLVRHMVEPLTLAVDPDLPSVIEKVGPGGHYLADPHTLRHMRQQWLPRLFDRESWEDWESAGRTGPREAAADRVRSLLAQHEAPGLDEDLDREIRRIIAGSERSLEAGSHG